MPARLLDGRTLAAEVKQSVKERIRELGNPPGLVAILVGTDPASHLYVNLKEKACAEVGIHFEKFLFFATEPESKIITAIEALNSRPDIHGILVQVPLPRPISEDRVIGAIDPKKDVDGFHPENLERIITGDPFIIPGVALGIRELIRAAHEPIEGKIATLLVNTTTFAAPIEYVLEKEGALVHIIIAPPDLNTITRELARADILVSAIGRPRVVTGHMIKPGATVIDVGTNRLPDGTLVGDIDAASVDEKAGARSPVPGGVGPLTVAMLLKNTIDLAEQEVWSSR